MSDRGSDEQVRVLVVDDEPNIVDVISMALRFEGFEVASRRDRRRRDRRGRRASARSCSSST